MVTSKSHKPIPPQYQPYAARLEQRKVKQRSHLQQRHQTGLKTAKELADLLKAHFGVTKVVLFGSMLSADTVRIKSDIDLAVWNLPPEEHIRALTALMTHAGPFDIDLVCIEEAPASLRTAILQNGLTLGEATPQSHEFIESNLTDSAEMKNYSALIGRIRQTVNDCNGECQHAKQQATLAKQTEQDVYWTAVGLSMHGLYTGLEKTFERIVHSVDGELVSHQQGQWNKDLLDQMMLDLPGVRPAVIDAESRQYLGQLLSFRHVIRSNYTHRLDPEKIADNFHLLEAAYNRIIQQLNDFCEFLTSVE
ncbi:MAG: nucleotidyltransferase domain-containing protein [Cyanobacteria bacterium J06623_4]